ncbi:PREDICTED: actin-related protein 2/3 complex subunit 2B [Ipomoea nil]|uniref:actin-related protein 2/3 complex subunit 2B n=1 Tax=Ipomoea nil TaxID=35883 RepID=UPI0009013006|nr:PREDICTED: actin-related protein 2/3 complex subunit 2B [Ipomoea nil]
MAACFERPSPALKEILLKIYRAETPIEIDHHLHEFGSVEYHIQHSASAPDYVCISISTPILSLAFLLTSRLSRYTMETVKGISPNVVDFVDPPNAGYQLTLRLDFTRIPKGKDSMKTITAISSVQAVILSSQLKEMLVNVNSQDVSQGMYKPIKLVYHPREPFYVIKSPEKITAVFPMRFRDKIDVVIATSFFQELMDAANTKACAKAPHCTWSAIPPPELRGEAIEDLSTNGGFVSFDITSRNVEGKRLDKTVWNLLNFYAFVKYHVKATRGFIQRKMRTRMQNLVEVLQKTGIQEDDRIKKGVQGRNKHRKRVLIFSKLKVCRQRYDVVSTMKRMRSRIKIHWFSRFRRRWLTFSSLTKYEKLN